MQQVLSGNGSSGFLNSATFGTRATEQCFKHLWDAREARFDLCALPWISGVPAIIAGVVLFHQSCRLAIPWRLQWTRPFVEEIEESLFSSATAPKRSFSTFTLLLAALSAIGFIPHLAYAAFSWPRIQAVAPTTFWFAVLGLIVTCRPRTAPLSILLVFVLEALAQTIMLADSNGTLEKVQRGLDIASLSVAVCGICVILCMPLRDPYLPAKDISRPMTESTSSLRSPEDNLNLWQFMTVSWMTPLIRTGYKKQLEDENVWQLGYEFQHQRLHNNFRLLKGTVIQRLLRANIVDVIILSCLGVLELILQYSTPLLLQRLLASMEDITAPKRAAVVYAAISMAARLVAAQSGIFSLWFGRRCYERSRGEMITMLYEKTLGRKIEFSTENQKDETNGNNEANGHANGNMTTKTEPSWMTKTWQKVQALYRHSSSPPPVKKPASMGKILNLMRNDVYEVAQRFWEIQGLIQKPLSAVISISLVVHMLGWSSMIAVLYIFVAQLINYGLARIMIHFEKKRRVATDDKLQIISQFVEAIRHLRWYGWQNTWLTQIMSARQRELNLRIVTSIWSLLIGFVNTTTLDLIPVIAFFGYTVIGGHQLRVDVAFPAMQLFQMMASSLRDLPQFIIVLINAWVAVGRIEDFMEEPDKQEMNTEALVGDSMAIDRATFSWPGSSHTVLKNINLSFPEGLTVVYGDVASGKTALLQALLGELDMIEGQLFKPDEPIAYCAQTPWLQSMSIRENIMFGSPCEDKRYKEVLDCCALTSDLADFKAGDLSFIGENGVGLSGGQKARCALARAVYSKARILLLDDPLSALDQQTAEAIVKTCFTGSLLRGRTVVLVTHRTDLVFGIAHQLVEVRDGHAFIRGVETLDQDSLQRTHSLISRDDAGQQELEELKNVAVPDKFIEDEHRAYGGVKASVYWEYVKAGKLRWWLVLIICLIIYRLCAVAEAWYIKAWGEAYGGPSTPGLLAFTEHDIETKAHFFDKILPPPETNVTPWLIGLFAVSFAQSIAFIVSQTFMVVIVYTAGKNMFIAIMEKVAGATFRFYDVTPIGRLMNRMTSDIGVIDGNISYQFQMVAWMGISWITSVVVIASVTPAFLVMGVVLISVFVIIFLRFLPTSQSLRRLEMVSLTPLMSNFGELLNGLVTVRAFCVQRQFQDRVVRVVDTFQKMDHFYWSLQGWLMYRYDLMSAISIFTLTVLALATNVSAGLTAFVLLSANKFVHNTHYLCKQYGQLQMEFVSVERVVELLHLEQEPKGDIRPPAWWPSFSGDIVFSDVTIKYAPHLEPALNGISFTVKGGSKTAVIGRTGSGKSTLALAMLATIVPDTGKILVDSVDLAEVDRQLLRTKVTFLAQDPVLFPGTMRQNLDPINEHSEEACTLVLDRVCERQGWSLDTKVEGGGRNLSQGQRQLVGLARAVLRRSAIIILDEATASIDRETAMQIQQVMHEEMADSTVITIAHRLEAVKNADYCIVLGKGTIIRQGPATEMLANSTGDVIDQAEEDESK